MRLDQELSSHEPVFPDMAMLALTQEDLNDAPKPTGTDDPVVIRDDQAKRVGKILKGDDRKDDSPGGYNWLSPVE